MEVRNTPFSRYTVPSFVAWPGKAAFIPPRAIGPMVVDWGAGVVMVTLMFSLAS